MMKFIIELNSLIVSKLFSFGSEYDRADIVHISRFLLKRFVYYIFILSVLTSILFCAVVSKKQTEQKQEREEKNVMKEPASQIITEETIIYEHEKINEGKNNEGEINGEAESKITNENIIPDEARDQKRGQESAEKIENNSEKDSEDKFKPKESQETEKIKDQISPDASVNTQQSHQSQEEFLRRQAMLEEERLRKERDELERLRLLKEQEEKEKRDREERLNRNDPERNMFFRKDVKNEFGNILKIKVPSGSEIFIARNKNITQFYGGADAGDVKFDYIFPVNNISDDLTEVLQKLKGSYVILFKTVDNSAKNEKLNYQLAEITSTRKKNIRILNIYSDGRDLLLVDGEDDMKTQLFYRWSVDKILLEK